MMRPSVVILLLRCNRRSWFIFRRKYVKKVRKCSGVSAPWSVRLLPGIRETEAKSGGSLALGKGWSRLFRTNVQKETLFNKSQIEMSVPHPIPSVTSWAGNTHRETLGTTRAFSSCLASLRLGWHALIKAETRWDMSAELLEEQGRFRQKTHVLIAAL